MDAALTHALNTCRFENGQHVMIGETSDGLVSRHLCGDSAGKTAQGSPSCHRCLELFERVDRERRARLADRQLGLF